MHDFNDYLTCLGLSTSTRAVFVSAARRAIEKHGEGISPEQLRVHREGLSTTYRPNFDTAWRHLCGFAKAQGVELPQRETIPDGWAVIYPVLFEHLWPVVVDCRIYPRELAMAQMGDFKVYDIAYEIKLHGRRRDALSRAGKRKVCDDHLMPILDWAHPVRPVDMDAPLLPIKPGSDMPLGRERITKILLAIKGKQARQDA